MSWINPASCPISRAALSASPVSRALSKAAATSGCRGAQLPLPACPALDESIAPAEEDRHLLALAFEGGLRGQDLLGKVLGRVDVGRNEAP
jgi:hypothetical protein